MTQTTEQSRAENNDCHETFVNKFCPYSGSPDPWQAARASVVPEDVLIYFQSIYVFIKSVAPYGFAEEVFRLPAGSTRNQKALLDAIKNNAFGELPQTQGKIGEREDQDARTFKVKTTTNHFRDVTKTMTDDQIRAIFLENGFTIKEGMTDLKPYVYQAARALLATVGAGGVEPLRKPVEDGWLQDGPLLYRLTDERRSRNRDEIIVTMANSSRTEEARTRRAGELLDAARASAVPIHVIELGKQVSESAVKQLVECLQQNENRFRPMTAEVQNIPHGRIDLEPRREFLLQEERDRRIYIAGPMTGIEDYNFPAFNRAAGMLRESGWVVENPADHGVVEGASWSDYLAYDLTRLGTCGAVYLLRGWQNSKGAKLEYLIAKELGMVIIEEWS